VATDVSLVAPTPRIVFRDADEFSANLQHLESETTFKEVQSLSDLTIQPDGYTPEGLRYTVGALRQVCTFLCRGLAQAVMDLGGVEGSDSPPSKTPKPKDAAVASELFSRLVKLRGNSIIGRRLVVHRAEGRIDGLVGSRFRPVSHSRFYGDLGTTIGENLVFHEAALEGRLLRVLVRDRTNTAARSSDEEDKFAGGWVFWNSDVGDCAVCGTAAVFRRRGDRRLWGACDKKTSVRHVDSKDFAKRLGERLAKAASMRADLVGCLERLDQLEGTSLGLGGIPEEHARKCKGLAQRLMRRLGLPFWIAQRSVHCVLKQGVNPGDSDCYFRWSQLTELDLWDAVAATARTLSSADEDAASQSAYRWMTNPL